MKKIVWAALIALGLYAAPADAVSINGKGSIAHGVGGAGAYIDATTLSTAGAGGTAWINDDHAIYQVCDGGCRLEEYTVSTGARVTVDRFGANDIQAGGGIWVKWLGCGDPTICGVTSSTGWHCFECGLIAVGPNGEIAYKPIYQSNGPFLVREPDGSTWKFSDVPAYDVQLLGQRRVIWTTSQRVFTAGLPAPATAVPAFWRPRVVFLAGGEAWVCYFTAEEGLILHPFNDASKGYKLRATPDAFKHDIAAVGPRTIRVAFATNEGETAGSIISIDVNVDTMPRVSLAVMPPPPPPAPTVKAAAVTVDKFTLTPNAKLSDGTVFEIHDPNNPQLATRVRAWVENGSIFFSIDYPGAGPGLAGKTGARRPVR
jgi:hypothetical protein